MQISDVIVRGGNDDNGIPPSGFIEPIWLLLFLTIISTQNLESLPPIGRGDWTKTGAEEGGRWWRGV
jgi:hypothetical protein